METDRTDRRVELTLGALSCAVLALIGFMLIFVFTKAWPSFAHNGLAWFGPGGDVNQQLADIFNSPGDPSAYHYTLHAWPLIWATLLITGISVALAMIIAVLSACSSSSSRRPASAGSSTRWCGCWPLFRR